MRFAISLLALALCLPAQRADARRARPLHESINAPGAKVFAKDHLVRGKKIVFHFYADWCGACKQWAPAVRAMKSDERFADLKIVCVDVRDWESPVAQQWGIQSLPNWRVFDGSGALLRAGKEAGAWVEQEIDRRVGRK